MAISRAHTESEKEVAEVSLLRFAPTHVGWNADFVQRTADMCKNQLRTAQNVRGSGRSRTSRREYARVTSEHRIKAVAAGINLPTPMTWR
jgi:hypothetical protein